MGRPRKRVPRDAAKAIEGLSSLGLTATGIAKQLGIGRDLLRRWLEEDPKLQEAADVGKEIERHKLHSKVREAADRGNIVAAFFLLKTRHGYAEATQADQPGRVHITFSMPAALKPEQFTIEASDDRSTEDQRLSIEGPVRS